MYTYICISCIYICMYIGLLVDLASKCMYYVSNIKIIHAKKNIK